MIVSISRELGAGGLTVGEAVAKTLGAQLLDERTIVGTLTERLGLSESYVAESVERPRGLGGLLIDVAYASAMLGRQREYRPTDEQLLAAARELVTETAAKGDVVVIGHGGPVLLRPFDRAQKLMILLYAGAEWRVAQVAQRFAIEPAEARRRVERVDAARAQYFQQNFRIHPYEARDYDLVLNTESLGLDNAISIACSVATTAAARSRQDATAGRSR
jgi:cytidylate kinase